jgi:hypothetical protein
MSAMALLTFAQMALTLANLYLLLVLVRRMRRLKLLEERLTQTLRPRRGTPSESKASSR